MFTMFALIHADKSPDAHVDLTHVPSPLNPWDDYNAHLDTCGDEESQGTDYLELEMEVQDLMDRMTKVESGHAHVLDMQRSIMKNEEQILLRLAALESRFTALSYQIPHRTHIPPPPIHAPPVLDNPLDCSFDHPRKDHFGPPPYIPPPPAHLPPAEPPLSPPFVPPRSHTPPSFDESGDDPGALCGTVNQIPRNPLRPLQQNTTQDFLRNHQRIQAPPKRKTAIITLPSSAINKGTLHQATTVFHKYPGLICESKIGTLATKLAREAFFGEDVLVKCTVAGERDWPGLPSEELRQLKHALYMQFPQYWQSPQEFEPLWKKCTESIGQTCKRLRKNTNSYTYTASNNQ